MKRAFRIFGTFAFVGLLIYAINWYIVCLEKQERKDYSKSLLSNKTPLKEGFQSLYDSAKDNTKVKAAKYFYVNIWETACRPCIMEMPFLDSLAGKLSPDIACFLVTEQNNEKITRFLEKRNIRFNNLIVKNDLTNFCSSVFNEKTRSKRYFPMHVIFDSKGKILYSRMGAMVPVDLILIGQFKKLGLLK